MKLRRIISVLLAGVLALSLGAALKPVPAMAEEAAFGMAVSCSDAPDHSYTVVTISLSGRAQNVRLELSAKDMAFVYEVGEDDHYRRLQVGDLDATGAPLELAVGIRGEEGKERGTLRVRAISDDQPIKEYNGVFDCRSVARALITVAPGYEENGEKQKWFENDLKMMEEVFEHCSWNGQSVQVTSVYDPKLILDTSEAMDGFLNLCTGMSIDSNDITYIYISAHGNKQGIGTYSAAKGFEVAYYETMLTWLQQNVPGRIVLILDACFTGNAVDIAKLEFLFGYNIIEDLADTRFADRFTILSATDSKGFSEAARHDYTLDGRLWPNGFTFFTYRLWNILAYSGQYGSYTGTQLHQALKSAQEKEKDREYNAQIYGEEKLDMFVDDPARMHPVAPSLISGEYASIEHSGAGSGDELQADIRWALDLLNHRSTCTVGLAGKGDDVKLDILATDVALAPHDPGDPHHLTVKVGERIQEDRGEYGFQVYDAVEGGAPSLTIRISAKGEDALEYRCDFDATAQPRALLVAAPGYYEASEGRQTKEARLHKWFETDLAIMKQALEGCYYNGASVAVDTAYDPQDFLAEDCLGRLKGMGIDDNDVTYVLLDAHGAPGGIGLTTGPDAGFTITDYGTLLRWLQQNVRGKVVLIVSSCFGGGIIDSAVDEEMYFSGLSEQLLAERFVILTATSAILEAKANETDEYERYLMDLATLLSGRDNPVGDVDIITSDLLKAWTAWENLQVNQFDMAPQVMSPGNAVPVFMLSPEARCPVAPRPTNERFLQASQIEELQAPQIEFDPVLRWEDDVPVMAVGEGSISWHAGGDAAYYHVVIAQENGGASDAYDWEASSHTFAFEPQDDGQTFTITVTAVPTGGTLADGKTSQARFRVEAQPQPAAAPAFTGPEVSSVDALMALYIQTIGECKGGELFYADLPEERGISMLVGEDAVYADDPYDALGYCFIDGDEESMLMIGRVDDRTGLVYDAYVIRDGVPRLILQSADRDRYYMDALHGTVRNEWSNGADDSGVDEYHWDEDYRLAPITEDDLWFCNPEWIGFTPFSQWKGSGDASAATDQAYAGDVPGEYGPILEEYARLAALGNDSLNAIWESEYCWFMEQIPLDGGNRLNTAGYCLRDLDGNGVPELVMGSTADSAYGERVMSVFTIDDGVPLQAFWPDEYAINQYTADGLICSDFGLPPDMGGVLYYRIEGDNAWGVEGYVTNYDDNGPVGPVYPVSDLGDIYDESYLNNTPLSASEVEAMLARHPVAGIGLRAIGGAGLAQASGGSASGSTSGSAGPAASGSQSLMPVLTAAAPDRLIRAFAQADYDGDGAEEAFALALEYEDDVASPGELWFVNGGGAVRCEAGCCYYVSASEIIVEDGVNCYQVIEGYEGPGSATRFWTCGGGEPYLYDGDYMVGYLALYGDYDEYGDYDGYDEYDEYDEYDAW